MIICPICETENEPGLEECILCGAPLEVELAPPEPLGPPPEAPVQPPPPVEPPSPPAQPVVAQTISPPAPAPEQPIAPEMPVAPSLAPEMPVAPSLAPEMPIAPSMAPISPVLPIAPKAPQDPISLQSQHPETPSMEIPAPGTLCLVVYFQRRPALYYPVIYDEILIGRQDPASNSYPDLDLTPYDPDLAISRKHSYLYRESNEYYIYPISNSGTQVNQEMVDIGIKKRIKEGDVIILSGRLAIRFARPT